MCHSGGAESALFGTVLVGGISLISWHAWCALRVDDGGDGHDDGDDTGTDCACKVVPMLSGEINVT